MDEFIVRKMSRVDGCAAVANRLFRVTSGFTKAFISRQLCPAKTHRCEHHKKATHKEKKCTPHNSPHRDRTAVLPVGPSYAGLQTDDGFTFAASVNSEVERRACSTGASFFIAFMASPDSHTEQPDCIRNIPAAVGVDIGWAQQRGIARVAQKK